MFHPFFWVYPQTSGCYLQKTICFEMECFEINGFWEAPSLDSETNLTCKSADHWAPNLTSHTFETMVLGTSFKQVDTSMGWLPQQPPSEPHLYCPKTSSCSCAVWHEDVASRIWLCCSPVEVSANKHVQLCFCQTFWDQNWNKGPKTLWLWRHRLVTMNVATPRPPGRTHGHQTWRTKERRLRWVPSVKVNWLSGGMNDNWEMINDDKWW